MANEDSKIVRSVTNKPADPAREDRGAADASRTQEDGTVLTMEQRKAMLRENFTSEVLPKVIGGQPDMHYVWLSTTNQTDPIFQRLRMGYELVKAAELPELAVQYRLDSGEFEGCISVREMILAKIHVELYQEIMNINHHERPLLEEERLRASVVKEDVEDSSGQQLGSLSAEDTGFSSFVRRRPAPKFA